MIRLHIFSDPICPWCYIGKARLDRALEQRPEHPLVVDWHPFQLNLGMPLIGMDRRQYMETKFGGQSGAVNAYLPVVQEAEATGLALNLEAIGRSPNTLDARRLIHWAGIEGKQNAVVDRLFRAYFVDGQDIGQAAVLTDVAKACGMDGDVVARLLATDADLDDMRARDKDARDKGVNSVPTFVIANQHVVAGAQPTEFWLQVIDELTAALAASEGSSDTPSESQSESPAQ